MLTILFSPSETKHSESNSSKLDTLLFGIKGRFKILDEYNKLIMSKDTKALHKLFGLKDNREFNRYTNDIYNALTCKAIYRYSGVAYKYLDIKTLDETAVNYIERNCIIFSNLYGPILAGDNITDYKLKQGESVADIKPDVFYKDNFGSKLDTYLENSDILDLRAGYYDKFYKPKKEFTTLKFIKDGKVVSHWAKAYRGIVLRELAKNSINSLEEFKKLELPNLHVKEIKKTKLKREIVFDII